mgnify:FL=1
MASSGRSCRYERRPRQKKAFLYSKLNTSVNWNDMGERILPILIKLVVANSGKVDDGDFLRTSLLDFCLINIKLSLHRRGTKLVESFRFENEI